MALTFLSWTRDGNSALATRQAGGRAEGEANITLTARGATGAVSGTATRPVPFLLAGSADVAGLAPSAIVRRYPAPGTLDHESDRCPYVELAEPALAWRYTPAATPGPTSANLHPWLVLIVGEEGPELILDDQQVTIETTVQGGSHALGQPGALRDSSLVVAIVNEWVVRTQSERRSGPLGGAAGLPRWSSALRGVVRLGEAGPEEAVMKRSDLAKAATPEAITENLAKQRRKMPRRHEHGPSTENVRQSEYRGHRIVIRTTYTVEVDGVPIVGHFGVTGDGQVHYHAVPNLSFASAVDVVKKLIDTFPEDFSGAEHPERHDEEA